MYLATSKIEVNLQQNYVSLLLEYRVEGLNTNLLVLVSVPKDPVSSQ